MREIVYLTQEEAREKLLPSPWRQGYILKPDLKALKANLVDYGWLEPIIVHRSTGYIIDGYYRVNLFLMFKDVAKAVEYVIPVTYYDGDELDAELLSLRLGRARGFQVPKFVSNSVKRLLRSKKIDEKYLKRNLAMGVDELSTLTETGTLKQFSGVEYNNAWIPVESSETLVKPEIERPPNKDR